ncbi:MAG: hypothetical protein ACK5Y2_10785 [Bdellovibrionales bacterium]
MKIFLFAVSLACALGCTKKNHFEYTEADVRVVEDLPKDFVVPDQIWNVTFPTDGNKPKQIIYTSARVIFREKNKSILREPLLVLEFPRGGGEVDLSHVVTGQPGTFFMKFEFPEFKDAAPAKVFFLSHSRQRKVEGEVLGSGCRKVLDVTKGLLSAQKDEGLKINTTRQRHSSILGGHFVVLGENEKNWLITQVTFYDSSRPDLFCPEFRSLL